MEGGQHFCFLAEWYESSMSWACCIDGCGETFESVEETIIHQAQAHEQHECAICGTVVPDGYLAIRHAFENHTRAEFVRAYDASAEEVRKREEVKRKVDYEADFQQVADQLNAPSP